MEEWGKMPSVNEQKVQPMSLHLLLPDGMILSSKSRWFWQFLLFVIFCFFRLYQKTKWLKSISLLAGRLGPSMTTTVPFIPPLLTICKVDWRHLCKFAGKQQKLKCQKGGRWNTSQELPGVEWLGELEGTWVTTSSNHQSEILLSSCEPLPERVIQTFQWHFLFSPSCRS